MPTLPHSPAAERSQGPILAVLRGLLGAEGRALEIASGTGQHAAHFAAALPGWHWQPTDADDAGFDTIRGWAMHTGATHVARPRRLNVLDTRWPSEGEPFAEPFDLVYAANLLHISPWPCCAGLMAGAARHLAPDGLLVVYGPFIEDDVPTAPSNLTFDADLRRRHPAWGLRQLDEVQRTAQAAGLQLTQRHALPANNLLLVFGRHR
ncbi:MAG: DUF938 domain-containing protein [Ottowia sp.]|nr:DUF938 domain-containing protein [Ottowia sp.]